jgi:hypothetical protein
MRSSLFWDVVLVRLVGSYPYNCVPECSIHSSWTAQPLKMGPIGCPETSMIINAHCLTSQKSEGLKEIVDHERNSKPLRSDREVQSRAFVFVTERTWT